MICFELPDIDKIKHYVEMVDSNTTIILVATKIDLYGIFTSPTNIQLIHPDVEKFAEQNDYELYYTSSKTGQNVGDVFFRVANLISQNDDELEFPEIEPLKLKLEDNMENSQCC